MQQQDFKFYAHLKKTKHEKFISFFKEHPLGTSNPIMTYFSILQPKDRVIILEQLFNPNCLNSSNLRDKLVLAYVKIGRVDLAKKVIEFSIQNGENDMNIFGLKSKLDLGIPAQQSDFERLSEINSWLSEIESGLYKQFFSQEQLDLHKQFLYMLIHFINEQ
ncbi:MAG: hypothetical protein LBC68_02040 [Prevotellaceae bacterium]|jgi:hypothetical protein|nr:hypothetical protein [Prevotellaceae bacterium]